MRTLGSSNTIAKYLTIIWLLLAAQISVNFAVEAANHTPPTYAENVAEPISQACNTVLLSANSLPEQTSIANACHSDALLQQHCELILYTEPLAYNAEVDLLSPFIWIISHQYYRSSLSNIFNH